MTISDAKQDDFAAALLKNACNDWSCRGFPNAASNPAGTWKDDGVLSLGQSKLLLSAFGSCELGAAPHFNFQCEIFNFEPPAEPPTGSKKGH